MGYCERQAAGRKRRSGSTVDTPFYPAPAQRRLLIVSATSKPATGARGRQRARLLPIVMGTRGYTLLELLISMAILLTVTGAVFEQINQMQKKSGAEAMKLDLNQAAREFLDQTVRDLHMSGYPAASMYSNPQDTSRVAQGLVSVSPTQILFEGDVNNDGTFYSVNIQYLANDPNNSSNPKIG